MLLILAGDGSGGNLAAVTAIRARDRSGPPIALQVLVYPVTDADLNRPSYLDPENESLLNRDAVISTFQNPLDAPSPTPLHCTSRISRSFHQL